MPFTLKPPSEVVVPVTASMVYGDDVPMPRNPAEVNVDVPVAPNDAFDAVIPPLKFKSVEVELFGKRYAKLPVLHGCGITEPLELMVRHCPAAVPRDVMARDVEVALPSVAFPVFVIFVEKKFPVENAVEEANGNWEASVDDEKNAPPRSQMDEVVAEVVVPKLVIDVKGYEAIDAEVR